MAGSSSSPPASWRMKAGNVSRSACVFQYFRQCKRLPTQRPSMITTTRTRPPPIASSPPTNCPVLAPAFEPSPRKRIHPAPGEPRLTRAVAAAHHVEGPASPRRRVPRPPRRGRSRGGRSGPCHGREVQPQHVPQHVPCDAAGRKAGTDSDAQGTGERGNDSDRPMGQRLGGGQSKDSDRAILALAHPGRR